MVSIDMIFQTGRSVEGENTEFTLEDMWGDEMSGQDVPVLELFL